MKFLLKIFGFYQSSYTGKGSYRTNYRDEACMQFTAKDEATLARLKAEGVL